VILHPRTFRQGRADPLLNLSRICGRQLGLPILLNSE
jgi:hypothetical protein